MKTSATYVSYVPFSSEAGIQRYDATFAVTTNFKLEKQTGHLHRVLHSELIPADCKHTDCKSA